jgi:uncharacterized DUF497 family protein
VTFEWDRDKAASNRRKHRVEFADAVAVFEDSRGQTTDDPHPSERRFVTLGLDTLGRVLVVCWTSRGTQIRIISARKANARERRFYSEEG